MKNISKHVSYKEGVRSNTALRLGIENTPGAEQLEKMEIVAKEVFEPLREWVKGPIKDNTGQMLICMVLLKKTLTSIK